MAARWAKGGVLGGVYWCLRYLVRFLVLCIPEFVKEYLGRRIVVVSVCLLRTTSTGTVKYNPDTGGTEVEMNYLGNEREVETLWGTWKEATGIMDGKRELTPFGVSGPKDVLSYARFMGTTYYHHHGSLFEVLDENGRLEGTRNVVVADASGVKGGVEAGTARATAVYGRRVGARLGERWKERMGPGGNGGERKKDK